MDNKITNSPAGVAVYNYEDPLPFDLASGEESLEQITAHVEKYIGKVNLVYHEILSDNVHVDVLIVNPTDEFPFYRLVTSGMSDKKMNIPPECDDSEQYMELMITLPADWKLDSKSFEDENWFWPVRLLKFLARFPHKYNTFLAYGHTIANDDEYTPFANGTNLSGSMILPPLNVADEFYSLKVNDEKIVNFYAIIPLYYSEMDFKLKNGTHEFFDLIVKHGLCDIIDPNRKPLV